MQRALTVILAQQLMQLVAVATKCIRLKLNLISEANSTEGLGHQVVADAGWPPSCSRLKLSLASEEAKQQWALRTR